jgi:hypothetical protein
MQLHSVVVTVEGAGVVIRPSPVIVRKGDLVVWFSADGPHDGLFDGRSPAAPVTIWSGPQGQPSSALTITVTAKNPPDPPDHFPYTVTVGTSVGHSEVIVIGP